MKIDDHIEVLEVVLGLLRQGQYRAATQKIINAIEEAKRKQSSEPTHGLEPSGLELDLPPTETKTVEPTDIPKVEIIGTDFVIEAGWDADAEWIDKVRDVLGEMMVAGIDIETIEKSANRMIEEAVKANVLWRV